MAPLIIGISGKKKSGKDTAWEVLNKCAWESEKTISRVAFADPLKEEVAKIYGVSVDYINTHKDNFRLILQGHGTEYRRGLFGADYWVNRLDLTVRGMTPRPDFVAITDVRFPDEAQYVKDSGGILVRIERPSSDAAADPHPSEVSLDDYNFDVTLFNTGAIWQFADDVEALWKNQILPLHSQQASS